ncbi:MAG: PEP-CTERM sorting domain-containing protein [Nibricoccus sp.]
MKTKTSTIIAATVAAALASVASAQITPDPTGTHTFVAPSATNAALYAAALGNSGGLGLYYASAANIPSTEVNTWTAVTQPSDISPTIPWLAGGGTVKTIFLGESAGSLNDFGYIKSTSPVGVAGSYVALETDINNPTTIQSGWESLVNYGAGEKLDFWLNNPGTVTPSIPGGTYFSFLLNTVPSQFAGGDPYTHVKFKWVSVVTEYQLPSGAYTTGPVDTLLIAFEDLRGTPLAPGSGAPVIPPGDADYTDFIVAFQFLTTQNAVPEPSTYGLIGAGALLGLVGYRRFKASKKAA